MVVDFKGQNQIDAMSLGANYSILLGCHLSLTNISLANRYESRKSNFATRRFRLC